MSLKKLFALAFAGVATAATVGEIYITIECEKCSDPGDNEAGQYKDMTKAIVEYLEGKGYEEDKDFTISLPADYKDPEEPYICKKHDDENFKWTRHTINADGDTICTDVRITGIKEDDFEKMTDKLKGYMYDKDSRNPTATFQEDAKLKGKNNNYEMDADSDKSAAAAPATGGGDDKDGGDVNDAVPPSTKTDEGACFAAFVEVFGAPAYLDKKIKSPICGNDVPEVDVGALPDDDKSKYEDNFAEALRIAVEKEIKNFDPKDCPEDEDLTLCITKLAELQTACADVDEKWATGLVEDINEELGTVSRVCMKDAETEDDSSHAYSLASALTGMALPLLAVALN